MVDPFYTTAGPAPARASDERWRQVALLGVSAAAFGEERARVSLGAALCALDHPAEAGAVLAPCPSQDAWARWWRVLAVGQCAGARGLAEALAAACVVEAAGPDAREVRRRLSDLREELAALRGDEAPGARFSLLGHRARPERRVLVAGRSSATFLLDPRWEELRLVRLAPSDGPSAGNGAHLHLGELIEAVRRGEAGQGRPVPADTPTELEPVAMLEALREDPGERDRRLIALAAEVSEERERLHDERAALADDRAALRAEWARLRRQRPAKENGTNGAKPQSVARLPKTVSEAAALLGVEPGAPKSTIERSWRELVARCHPDRVDGLHPEIRSRAEDLTVSLNAARDILLNGVPRRRVQA